MTKTEIMQKVMDLSHKYYEYMTEENDVARDIIFSQMAHLYSELCGDLEKIKI